MLVLIIALFSAKLQIGGGTEGNSKITFRMSMKTCYDPSLELSGPVLKIRRVIGISLG